MSESSTAGDATARPKLAGLPEIDTNEYGGKRDGERQVMDRRLYMQLLVFDVDGGSNPDGIAQGLHAELTERKVGHVIYADANAPRGLGVLTWGEDPAVFVDEVRPAVLSKGSLVQRPDFTMLGRTYSTGYEPDLAHVLLKRPIEYSTNTSWPWHVWYPLRRTGSFQRLPPEEQGSILREHASIGFAYGQRELAHDVRLACYGLDAKDNEFVIGLVGSDLHPLSHLVQTMRKTRQTSEFIAQMGPFFVGKILHVWSAP